MCEKIHPERCRHHARIEAIIDLPQRYLIFLGEITDPSTAKTAFGLRDWAPERCVGEYSLPGCTVSTGLPRLSPPRRASAAPTDSSSASPTSAACCTETWIPTLLEALDAGLDIVNGMHSRWKTGLSCGKRQNDIGRRLINVRRPPAGISVGSGRKRSGKRLLTVGTDCALGKKYTALSLTRAFKARGSTQTSAGTGQTGIMIAGAGIPIDAVVADFVAGAAESLSPDARCRIIGTSSRARARCSTRPTPACRSGCSTARSPTSSSCATRLDRSHIIDVPQFPIPSLAEAIELNLRHAQRTNPLVRCAGISLNTAHLGEAEARSTLAEHSARLRLPAADPMRGGPEFERLVQACLAI